MAVSARLGSAKLRHVCLFIQPVTAISNHHTTYPSLPQRELAQPGRRRICQFTSCILFFGSLLSGRFQVLHNLTVLLSQPLFFFPLLAFTGKLQVVCPP
jgi:hypothetical protein